MAETEDHRALVFVGTRLVGIVSPTDITQMLARAELIRPN
jgi:hypothetical protein